MLFQGAGPDITPSARRRSGGSGGRLWDLLRRNATQAKETLELAKVEYMDLLGVSPSFAELMDVSHAAARTLY